MIICIGKKTDKNKVKCINDIIKSCLRNPFDGIGKPEALKGDLQSCWSRRIDIGHRLVYKCENDTLSIVACRYHYSR